MPQENNVIRILHVLGRLDRGGAETLVMNLYRAMDRTKIQFDFVIHTEDECDYCQEILDFGGRIHSMVRIQDVGPIEYKKAWKKFFAEHLEYRIVHGHMRSTASIYLKEAKKYGRVAIAHSHNTSSGKGISAIAKNLLQLPLRYCADWYIGCSIQSAQWLFGKNIIKRPNFFVLKNVVNTKLFEYDRLLGKEKRKNLGISDVATVYLNIGRLEAQKNHIFLLKIFEEIISLDDNARLLICGVGPEEEKIRQYIYEHNMGKAVLTLGNRKDIPELMSASNVFIMPSLFEGLPVTLVEVQSNGMAAVISDNITNEVEVTDLFERVAVTDSPRTWAERAISVAVSNRELEDNQRRQYAKLVLEAGFDVHSEAKKLFEFYIGL